MEPSVPSLLRKVMSMTLNEVSISNSTDTRKQELKKLTVNWHKAISNAIQIELMDFSHLLEFKSEQILGKNSYRIDLLIVKKLADRPILKNIAAAFRTYNLFEIKGVGSTLSTDAYYKTIGYAGLFIAQTGNRNQITASDLTLNFLCMCYPRNLMRHLTKERHLVVAKSSQGIYTIVKETFYSQIIVMSELTLEENLYLRGLAEKVPDKSLQNRITANCIRHNDQPIYNHFLDQYIRTTSKTKGDTSMVCEAALELFGTSSKEIAQQVAQKVREEDQAQIAQLTQNNNLLSSHIQYLQSLLTQNNIAFDSYID